MWILNILGGKVFKLFEMSLDVSKFVQMSLFNPICSFFVGCGQVNLNYLSWFGHFIYLYSSTFNSSCKFVQMSLFNLTTF